MAKQPDFEAQERAVEKALADAAELAALEREERGEVLDLVGELGDIYNSTSVEGLRMRRAFACIEARAAEIRLAHLDRGDWAGLVIGAWCRGLRWDVGAKDWLPSVAPGMASVRLRRVDGHEGFVYKHGPRSLDATEMREVSKAWQVADVVTRGPDPLYEWRRVTPDPKTGEFTLPLLEAQKVWRAFADTPTRSRARREGRPDPNPIIAEVGPRAAFVPLPVLDAPEVSP